jgi:hypothetical protein
VYERCSNGPREDFRAGHRRPVLAARGTLWDGVICVIVCSSAPDLLLSMPLAKGAGTLRPIGLW